MTALIFNGQSLFNGQSIFNMRRGLMAMLVEVEWLLVGGDEQITINQSPSPSATAPIVVGGVEQLTITG